MHVFNAYIELTKPRLTALVLATAGLGFFMASDHRSIQWLTMGWMLVGAGFLGGGVSALNQYYERDFDALMQRTKSRPLPSKRIEPSQAMLFGYLLSLAGLLILWIRVGIPCAVVGLVTMVSYVLFYTPLKRVTPLNTLVGAIPGALPTLIGWIAATGRISWSGITLFLILFTWQIPHFFSIAWIYKHDYASSGFKMISLSDVDGKMTAGWMVWTSALLLGVSFLPIQAGLVGMLYALIVVSAGVAVLAYAVYVRLNDMRGMRLFLLLTIYYMLAVIVGMTTDKLL